MVVRLCPEKEWECECAVDYDGHAPLHIHRRRVDEEVLTADVVECVLWDLCSDRPIPSGIFIYISFTLTMRNRDKL